ncbi:TonB-dependent siderophore receptor [Caulobacter sp. 17J80-11]|uniref:TonB-dependent receptor n=1 Tax=Caulobacter sp. 17J80-11 TaxID=2763502 RepID=UPI00165346B6|nr:TonB-dependent siderophore receptor [Caulobacter sp. 17J80-11]MBC6983593.1 TonB-dependent siderophore receptor [Caulobacter sp. 17J80-11]
MRSSNPSGVKAAAKTAVLRVSLAGAAAALLAPAALAETAELDEPTSVSSVTVEAPGAERSADPKIGKLLDAPQSITIVPQEVIEARGATTLRDVLRNVPGISMQAGEGGVPNGDNLTIRGFSARTDMFVDGVRDVGGYTRDSFNLESVEVIKGPASAYVGRGSTGGSINQVSKTPTLDRFVAGTVGGGSSAYARATVDANLPVSDTVALRLNAMAYSADAPGRDEVYARRWGVAPTIAFGLETATRLTAGWLHLEQDNMPDYGIPWVPETNTNPTLAAWRGKPAPVDPSNFYGLVNRDYEDVRTDVGTVKIERDVSDAVSLSNTLRYIRTHRDSVVSSPRFASASSADVVAEFKHRDQTDEILINQTLLTARFATGALDHKAVAGLELSREDSKNHFLSGPNSSPTNLYNPDFRRPYTGTIVDNGINKVRGDSVSLYAFDTVALNEHWEVAAGLRWDRYELTYNPVQALSVTPQQPNTSVDFNRKTDEMVSWKAGLIYKPTSNGSVYFGYGTSFNPGIDFVNLASATPTNTTLDPEESRSYELGTKWELLDKSLLVTAALFRTEKTNARTPTSAFDSTVILEGEQRVDGFEIGVSGQLTETLSVFAGYTWMDGTIVKSNTVTNLIPEQGKTLSNTPENTFNVWATWEPVQKVQLGAGAQYVGARFANNTNTREVPEYWTFDAMAAYDVTDDVSVRVNVYNLADERYFDNVGGGHLAPGAARSAVLSLGFRF